MTVEKESGVEEEVNNCVLIGIQIDENGKELLNYALNSAIEEGARVIALYVSRSSDLGKTTQSSIRTLNSFLAEFEELCDSKMVTLTGRVARGISIRRTIVKEALQCGATKVIVGRNPNIALGCSSSVAKYCLKKLPPTTSLIAFHNGEVFLERMSKKPPQAEIPKQNLRSILHPNISLSIEDSEEFENDRCLLVSRKSPELKPGWPLLKKAINANIEKSKENEARNMSVVQWVMNLPDRSLLSIKSATSDLINELENILRKNSSTCKWFHYEELQRATNCFSKDYLIGEGGSSRVYKGCLANGDKIAIKLSKLSNETSKDFLLEADIITKLQHERIVPLLGICVECNTFLSIYGYFSKGSLEENLHGSKAKTPPLSWDKRYKIAVGVAEALSYLHAGSSESVVHRDVKSSNILLDDKFEPQLSDFGLAVWAPKNSLFQTHSDIVGTFGYLAPEYFMYGKVSSKIDVYAYGVVLLELLTGRKPISDDSPKGQESLVMWAIPRLEKGNLNGFLDPNINRKFDENQLRRMTTVSSLCITRTARHRPQMSQVLSLLKGDLEIQSWLSSKSITECQDEEAYPSSSIGSHLELALLDVEEDDASEISFEQNHLSSLDEYLRERWSRSSSFD